MTDASFINVEQHLRDCVARGVFPSAQYAIGERGEIVSDGAFGYAVVEPEPISATPDTIYDLASLTKPLVTTLLAVMFHERGAIDLCAPIGSYLDELRDTDKSSITLTQLLTHTSGLEVWRPLYLEARGREAVVAAIACAPRAATRPAPVVYSDLNFILLGFILERLAAERLDAIARRQIFAPLALRRTMFTPPAECRRQVAATEAGQSHERETVKKMNFVCPLPENYNGKSGNPRSREMADEADEAGTERRSNQPLRRKGLILGEVHDGNAYFMDGVAGHAGLFSTAREVFRLANQFLRGSRLLSDASISLFTKNFTAGRGDARSLGWMLAATPGCSAGPNLPPDAFGHTGFTGTSVWVDPHKRRVFILLTNRVHPRVRDKGMKQARQRFQALAAKAFDRR